MFSVEAALNPERSVPAADLIDEVKRERVLGGDGSVRGVEIQIRTAEERSERME